MIVVLVDRNSRGSDLCRDLAQIFDKNTVWDVAMVWLKLELHRITLADFYTERNWFSDDGYGT
jgi:hypothetical protein